MYKYQKVFFFSVEIYYSRCGLVPFDNKFGKFVSLCGHKATSVLKQITKRVFKPCLVRSADDY